MKDIFGVEIPKRPPCCLVVMHVQNYDHLEICTILRDGDAATEIHNIENSWPVILPNGWMEKSFAAQYDGTPESVGKMYDKAIRYYRILLKDARKSEEAALRTLQTTQYMNVGTDWQKILDLSAGKCAKENREHLESLVDMLKAHRNGVLHPKPAPKTKTLVGQIVEVEVSGPFEKKCMTGELLYYDATGRMRIGTDSRILDFPPGIAKIISR